MDGNHRLVASPANVYTMWAIDGLESRNGLAQTVFLYGSSIGNQAELVS